MTLEELVKKVCDYYNTSDFGSNPSQIYSFLWENSCYTNEDWDEKGCLKTVVVKTGEDEYYSVVGSHSNGWFNDIEEGPEKVEKKTKTITYYE